MHRQLLLVFLFIILCKTNTDAQTGPAGVGATATNCLWLKADAATVTTTDGAPISFWGDNSGNLFSVMQSVAAQRPTYKASLMNGFPAIEFDNNATAGQNDMLIGPDAPQLDNTSGYTFFTVTRMKGLDGNAKSILSKRTTIDVDEAFMLFYYTGNSIYLDIDGLGDRFSTPNTYSANTNYIIDAVYDGSLAMANRSKIYEGELLRKTAAESSALVPDKTSPLMVGATHASDNRPFNGYISEIILYRTALNDASRIIVNNYLSAKYDIALAANDKYVGDNSSNGDYDRDVAGVGKESSGSNNAFATSIAAGLGISVNSGLDNGDYLLAGHTTPVNAQITTDVSGMTGTLNARWKRIWYFDVTNTATSINTNIQFSMNDGMPYSAPLGLASDYVLLYRAGQTGAWTELATASGISADKVLFNGISFAGDANDGYYTIGTHNYLVSPLPIELLSFTAVMNKDHVDLAWKTASERNNAYFTVERSKDGITFETVNTVPGAGNSSQTLEYNDKDNAPYSGFSYYRLKQTDYDGHSTYSDMVTVYNESAGNGDITLYPNPLSGGESLNMRLTGLGNQQVSVQLRDVSGREFYSKVIIVSGNDELLAIDPSQQLAAGVYIVVASSDKKLYSRKLIVK